MKRRLLILVIAAIAATVGPIAAQTGSLKLPAYKKVKLQNGMILLLMERHALPLVSFQVIVNAGPIADPAGQAGVASLTAALLRKGTATRSADQFSSELDFVGGQFNAGVTPDYANISADFMAKDLAKGLDLLADAMLNPTFPQEEVDKLVRQRMDGIKSAKDQALAVLPIYFNAFLYGEHPYARPVNGDENSLPRVTRDAIVQFYRAHYTPGVTTLAVVGDFDSAAVQKMISQKFGAWPSRPVQFVVTIDYPEVKGKRLLLVDKPDATQTYYAVGNVGIERTNPDRVDLQVVNTLFGGRFTSMINSELRIKSGLTYGASSRFDQRKSRGPFLISTYTRTATTEKAMDLTLDVMRRLQEKGITQEELDSAKNYIKGQFPPTIETNGQLASQLAQLEFYGLDESEINDLYAKIDAMTLADAQRVIHQYFPLDNLTFVVIGKASEISPVVRKYAPKVETRSISEPGFGAHL
ncbi:MAG: pitrilysin family protein [Terriglobia bacterium]|jgi:predicted Zn-dependent peptidase